MEEAAGPKPGLVKRAAAQVAPAFSDSATRSQRIAAGIKGIAGVAGIVGGGIGADDGITELVHHPPFVLTQAGDMVAAAAPYLAVGGPSVAIPMAATLVVPWFQMADQNPERRAQTVSFCRRTAIGSAIVATGIGLVAGVGDAAGTNMHVLTEIATIIGSVGAGTALSGAFWRRGMPKAAAPPKALAE